MPVHQDPGKTTFTTSLKDLEDREALFVRNNVGQVAAVARASDPELEHRP